MRTHSLAKGPEQRSGPEFTDLPPGESMWELLSEKYLYCAPQRGDIRKGIVLSVRPDEVLVDIGTKSTGVVSAADLERLDPEVRAALKPGAEVLVCVLDSVPTEQGEIRCSIHLAQAAQDWERAQEYMEQGTIFEGEVVGQNRGGLLIQFGRIQAFCPLSQLSSFRRESPSEDYASFLRAFLGRKLPLKVIEIDPSRRRLIVSERQARRAQQRLERERLAETLRAGQVCRGVVSSFCDFGAFIDLGGVEGLLHLSEISWERVHHPQEALRLGQEVEVLVLAVDMERGRIALSMKRLQPDPWVGIAERYRVGQIVEGTVTNVLKFGAFVRLEAGVEGLLHVSELAETPVEDPAKMLHVGDRLRLRLLQIDAANHRLALSLKQVGEQEERRS